MIDLKKLIRKLLFPSLWVIIILTAVCAAALVLAFLEFGEQHPFSYAAYVLSFYTLSVICIFCYKVLPGYYRSAKEKVYANKFGNRYLTDAAFRTHVSLYLSLAVNLIYVAVNIISGVLYGSAWFDILAGYYTILALMRFLLLRFVKQNGIGRERILEYRRSRLCGIILLTLNLTLTGAVLMILYQNKGYEYNGILIYIMAMYTFYMTIHSIIDIVKYRKYQSPVMSTAKVISLAAALVSMLALETAMLSQFGAENTSPYFDRIMIGATGGGVSLVVITMSVYTILRATKQIKKLNNSGETDNG
ncbi:MAG: hypothetical protein IJZ89_09420 [Clostridia bacterium]|nr:hypothetical protein [Clostridia bacterium]